MLNFVGIDGGKYKIINLFNMTLELSLILGFLFHLLGDYIFQNDWMAQNKTKNSYVALLHATIYSLPFLLVCYSWWWLLIWITHFLIDRFRLSVYWIKFVNWNWGSTNFGYKEQTPPFMSIWLMIIIDNIFHLLINSGTIILNSLL